MVRRRRRRRFHTMTSHVTVELLRALRLAVHIPRRFLKARQIFHAVPVLIVHGVGAACSCEAILARPSALGRRDHLDQCRKAQGDERSLASATEHSPGSRAAARCAVVVPGEMRQLMAADGDAAASASPTGRAQLPLVHFKRICRTHACTTTLPPRCAMAGPRPLCKTHTGSLIVSRKNKASSLSPLSTPPPLSYTYASLDAL